MGMIDDINKLNMEVDKKFAQTPLIEALDLYHSLIENNIIKPRENQLAGAGMIPPVVQFNKRNSI